MRKLPVVLAIAGSDSGGGAGIQADIKTLAALGVHGTTAITAITAQNSTGVQEIHDVPIHVVSKQWESVFDDIPVAAIKTGMLGSPELIEKVAQLLEAKSTLPCVVDPVMIAQSGDSLISKDARVSLLNVLIPRARIVTPNIPEAEALSGIEIDGVSSMQKAAEFLVSKGAGAALVKGGHGRGDESTDVLFDGTEFHFQSFPRIQTTSNHGTGCTLASALAARLAHGDELKDAFIFAKRFVTGAIIHGISVGRGHGCVDTLGTLFRESHRYGVLNELLAAATRLENGPFGPLVPEVQANLAYAIPGAVEVQDVAAFPGRIVRLDGRMLPIGRPNFGASSHVARIVLAVMASFPKHRAAMNIRWEPKILDACRRAGLERTSFDRGDEPENVTDEEGGSLPFGVRSVLVGRETCPDIIEDPGGFGKEPMIRLLGRDPKDILSKLERIAAFLGDSMKENSQSV